MIRNYASLRTPPPPPPARSRATAIATKLLAGFVRPLPPSPARDVYLLVRPRALLTPDTEKFHPPEIRLRAVRPRTDIFIGRRDRRGSNFARVSPNRVRDPGRRSKSRNNPRCARRQTPADLARHLADIDTGTLVARLGGEGTRG